jgi:phosphonate transport system substrate-binding protein
MKKLHTLKLTVAVLLTLLLLPPVTGCRSKTALDSNGVPNTLMVAVYQGDNPGETLQVMALVKKYMEKELGVKVEYQYSTDYTTVIEAMVTGKVHMAYLSPFSYVLATQKQRLIPMVAPGFHGRPFTYTSMIFTHPGSGLHNMEDVKARSHELTLCFADPASTSGHLVPAAYLKSIGLDPKTAFKQSLYAGSHAASLLSVKSGKIDVGCSFQLAYEKAVRDGLLKPGDLVPLWVSDPIVEGPICMRPEVSPAFTAKVQDVLLRMPRDGREAFQAYMSRYFPKMSDSLAYLPAYDSLYNPLRRIAVDIGDLQTSKN